MSKPRFESIARYTLGHAGDCSLLGVGADGAIYAEEIYGDGWMAQRALNASGAVVTEVDEQDGAVEVAPLALPDDLIRPRAGWHTMRLNFSGPRQRGLREPERVYELVKPLTLPEKLMLNSRYQLDAPPLLLGLAESYVLAEAPLIGASLFLLCRRIRVAAALPDPKIDADGLPYDYDTRVLYLAHLFDRDADETPTLLDPEKDLIDAGLRRPMDCLIANDRLYVADGGEGERMSAVHVYQLHDLPERPSPDDLILKKLYG